MQAHAELTGRVSPQINKLAEQYLRTLTAERYTAMQLYTDLEATCRRENSAVEMDRLRAVHGHPRPAVFGTASCRVQGAAGQDG